MTETPGSGSNLSQFVRDVSRTASQPCNIRERSLRHCFVSAAAQRPRLGSGRQWGVLASFAKATT